MIIQAKASLLAVKAFEKETNTVLNYAARLDQGLICFEELLFDLREQSVQITESKNALHNAEEPLISKISTLTEKVSRLMSQLESLRDKESALESKLARQSPTITRRDSEGNTYEVDNPAYEATMARLDSVQASISSTEADLYRTAQRLERAKSIADQIEAHVDRLDATLHSIDEKITSCGHLRDQILEIKTPTEKKSQHAASKIHKIVAIIDQYLRIKMNYVNITSSKVMQPAVSGINININVNRTEYTEIIHETREIPLKRIDQANLSQEYIKQHGIKLNEFGRVCEFEGRKYGGKYNNYDVRLSRSSQNTPVLGEYDGERGNSTYIPSGRSADGIAVIEILSKYGLNGITYYNAEPDFEVCAESIVEIENMTENRNDYFSPDGNIMPGNFTQADIECAKLWSRQNKDGITQWKPRDVLIYRKANRLTWHEKCDTHTMVLVRTEINDYFRHLGGVSECKVRDAVNTMSGGDFDE